MAKVEQPLYKQVKNAVDRRIESAEWPADFQVPAESELAQAFGASPLTVRRALRELQAEGVLIRIKGRGTFVVGPRMQCAVFTLSDMSKEIMLAGGAHSCQVLQLCILPEESPLRNMLLLPPNHVIYYSRLLHSEDGTPIQIEDRFINAAEAPGYIEQDFTKVTPHNYLLRETSVTTVDNTIRSIRADEDSRRLLQIEPSQPCLLLDRSTWRDGVPVTRSRFLYPGDRYRLRSSHEALTSGIVTHPHNKKEDTGLL